MRHKHIPTTTSHIQHSVLLFYPFLFRSNGTGTAHTRRAPYPATATSSSTATSGAIHHTDPTRGVPRPVRTTGSSSASGSPPTDGTDSTAHDSSKSRWCLPSCNRKPYGKFCCCMPFFFVLPLCYLSGTLMHYLFIVLWEMETFSMIVWNVISLPGGRFINVGSVVKPYTDISFVYFIDIPKKGLHTNH